MAERHQLLDGGTRGARRKHRGVQLRVEARYREVLAKNVPTFFIHLNGSHELIQQRLSERKGHFMPPALLPSQFAILEPLAPKRTAWKSPSKAASTKWFDRAIEAAERLCDNRSRDGGSPNRNPGRLTHHPPVRMCPILQKRTNRTQKHQPNCPIHRKRTSKHQKPAYERPILQKRTLHTA